MRFPIRSLVLCLLTVAIVLGGAQVASAATVTFSPDHGAVGESNTVTVTVAASLSGGTQLYFNGTRVTSPGWTQNGKPYSKIWGFTLPWGATSGKVSVVSGVTTSTSTATFSINPYMYQVSADSPTQVDAVLSEAVDPTTVQLTDFSVSGLDITDAALQPDGKTVVLTCATQVPGRYYTATVARGSVTGVNGLTLAGPNTATFYGHAGPWTETDGVHGVSASFPLVTTAAPLSATVPFALRIPPAGFAPVDGTYFDLSTATDFDSDAGFTITVPYDPAKVSDQSKLNLYHWDETAGAWVDITTDVDATAHTVSGHAHSFSDYAIMEPVFAINTYTLSYTAGAGGTIGGTTPQVVDWGTSGTAVTATPNAGYHFTGWSDSVATAARTDSTVTGDITVSATFAINTNLMPVWRFRNLKNGFYLWSADPNEKATIINTLSATWLLEGVAYNINTSNPLNSSPLWRFRNIRGGFYLYTADPSEKANIINTLGGTWLYEGPAYSVSMNSSGTAPVWRFRNLHDGTYLYSADPYEKNTIVATLGSTWLLEGPAYYLAP
jgi:Divergent InlB B-repeat domain/Repeat of unknown function (DUF5648)